jgi:hypothetical protein
MPKFRKKPVVIEAVQWTGFNFTESEAFMGEPAGHGRYDSPPLGASKRLISTLEGEMAASPGDWIIKGIKGEFYPCRPDIFAATYEPVESIEDCDACRGTGLSVAADQVGVCPRCYRGANRMIDHTDVTIEQALANLCPYCFYQESPAVAWKRRQDALTVLENLAPGLLERCRRAEAELERMRAQHPETGGCYEALPKLRAELAAANAEVKRWQDKEIHEAMDCWKDNEALKAENAELKAEAGKRPSRG